jgi:hypothetical protein
MWEGVLYIALCDQMYVHHLQQIGEFLPVSSTNKTDSLDMFEDNS